MVIATRYCSIKRQKTVANGNYAEDAYYGEELHCNECGGTMMAVNEPSVMAVGRYGEEEEEWKDFFFGISI